MPAPFSLFSKRRSSAGPNASLVLTVRWTFSSRRGRRRSAFLRILSARDSYEQRAPNRTAVFSLRASCFLVGRCLCRRWYFASVSRGSVKSYGFTTGDPGRNDGSSDLHVI